MFSSLASGDAFLTLGGLVGATPLFAKKRFKKSYYFLIWVLAHFSGVLYYIYLSIKFDMERSFVLSTSMTSLIVILTSTKMCWLNFEDAQMILIKLDKMKIELCSIHGIFTLQQKYTGFIVLGMSFVSLGLYVNVIWSMYEIQGTTLLHGLLPIGVDAFLIHEQSLCSYFFVHSIQNRYNFFHLALKKLLSGRIQSLRVIRMASTFNYSGVLFTFLSGVYGILMGIKYNQFLFSNSIILVLVFTLVQYFLFINTCQIIEQKRDKSVNYVSRFREHIKDKEGRAILKQLEQQVYCCNPKISAAGIFNVNYAGSFMLANLLLTYMIAVVQFVHD